MEPFSLSRRGWVRVVSFLTAAFLILCGFVIVERNQSLQFERSLEASRQHAFQELSTAVDEIAVSLEKASCTNSPALISALCTQVYGKATAAQLSLGELPYANVELEQTAAFLSRVGDYACAVSKSVSQDSGWTEEELESWQTLSQQAKTLDQQLSQLEADILAGQQSLESVEQAEERLSQQTEDEDEALTSGSSYEDIESEFSELPALIYDGPFSQHLEGRSPAALEGLEEISYAEARQLTAALLELSLEQIEFVSEEEGTIPGWLFSAQKGETSCTVQLSRAGGKLVQFFTSSNGTEAALTPEEGVAIAAQWLEQQGYSSMQETYYHLDGAALSVNFAYEQDGVLCYPDLIKVTVALDTGEVTGLDARGYLMNHQLRKLSPAVISQEDAQAQVPQWVTLLSTRLVVIPSAGEYDTLCYELKGETQSGRHVIYYVNALQGGTERLLLLEEDENGTLVI